MKNHGLALVWISLVVLIGSGVNLSLAQELSVEEEVAQRIEAMLTLGDGPDDINIRVVAPLDEPRYYCVDIPGQNDQFEGVVMSLHSCKDGMRHRDTIFSASRAAEGELFMPDYDLCLAADTLERGGAVKLAVCEGTSVRWQIADGGISPENAPALCLTAGAEPGALTSGGRRYPTRFMSRSLVLDNCSVDLQDRQQWVLSEPRKDLQGPILPDGTPADINAWARVFEENIRATRANNQD